MASFNNDLRLKEINTGAESGTWGTSTNTNLSLVAEAFSFGTEAITTNANTHTTTIADGSTDPGRSLYLKYTGALDSDCTITLAPNTVSKVWFIENATTDSGSGGPYNIIISQGSGSNVTIPNGSVMAVYSDGGGSSANIVSVLTDIVLTDSVKITGTTPTLTIGDGGEEDTKVVFDGNAKDFYVGLDDTSDKLVMGVGSTVGTNSILSLTDDTVTIGDGSAVDSKIVFDGNAVDYYMGLDDSSDQLIIGRESTVGSLKGIVVNTNCASNILTIGGSYSLESRSADGGVIGHFLAETAEALIRTDTLGDNPVDFGSDTSGNFVVKTGSTPTKRFSISDNSTGDVNLHTGGLFFDTADAGIYLRSANNTEYKITVSNAGALVVTAT
jgi:hypothetical protein